MKSILFVLIIFVCRMLCFCIICRGQDNDLAGIRVYTMTNNEREDSLFYRSNKYLRLDISDLVNHQVPDSLQLREIQKKISLYPDVKTMTTGVYSNFNKFGFWIRRVVGEQDDAVSIFFKSLVERDFNVTKQDWRRGDWTIQSFTSENNDPNFYFYTIFSDDTDLKFYFYAILIHTDSVVTSIKNGGTSDNSPLTAKQNDTPIIRSFPEENGNFSNPMFDKKNDSIGILIPQNGDNVSQNKLFSINDEIIFYNPTTNKKFINYLIYFNKNSFAIKQKELSFIKNLAQWLKNNPTVNMEIDGHTDNDGTLAANMLLSQRRAEEVKRQLISLGVNESRLTAKGYGASVPISPNTTPQGKANNRRVEFIKR